LGTAYLIVYIGYVLVAGWFLRSFLTAVVCWLIAGVIVHGGLL